MYASHEIARRQHRIYSCEHGTGCSTPPCDKMRACSIHSGTSCTGIESCMLKSAASPAAVPSCMYSGFEAQTMVSKLMKRMNQWMDQTSSRTPPIAACEMLLATGTSRLVASARFGSSSAYTIGNPLLAPSIRRVGLSVSCASTCPPTCIRRHHLAFVAHNVAIAVRVLHCDALNNMNIVDPGP